MMRSLVVDTGPADRRNAEHDLRTHETATVMSPREEKHLGTSISGRVRARTRRGMRRQAYSRPARPPVQWREYREENPMIVRWITLLGAAALLAACSAPPTYSTAHQEWDGGVWNSVLGYVGPDNVRVTGGPSR
jgi:hypothetical protein